MNELLKIILSLSLSGALLILVIHLCKPAIKNKLSKRWQYYIWLIVVARLLLPFAPETNLMGIIFQHFDNTAIQTNTNSEIEREPPTLPEEDSSNQYNIPSQVGSDHDEQWKTNQAIAPNMLELLKRNFTVICLLVWLIVAVGLFIRKITVYQSFVKYVQAGQREVTDLVLWEQLGKMVAQTGVKGAVGLYTNSLISSPLLVGFFRPCIMLPSTDLSESDFQCTILHELMHCKRQDMFYKWLVQFTVCLHWFNPLAHLMSREMSRACELSCDEAVLRTLDSEGRRAYGDTLLNAMAAGGNYKDSLASVTLSEGSKRLKERLDAIMNFKRKTNRTTAISVAFAMALCFGASATGVYAATPRFPDVSGEKAISIGELKDSETFPSSSSESSTNHFGASEFKKAEDYYNQAAPMIPYTTEEADKRGREIMEFSGTWGQTMEEVLPYMSNKGIDEAVKIYNQKHPGAHKNASDYYNSAPVSSAPTESKGAGFDYHVFNRLDTMTSAEIDALALSYIAATGEFGHIYNLQPYMTTAGVDAAVKAYLDANGDVGVVLAILPHMSEAMAKKVKIQALNEW